MKTTSYPIGKNLHLVALEREDVITLVPPPATHHIAVIDVSGSMAGDLPKLRKHLHEKLPTLIGENDRISVIAFSGRGEVYEVVSCESVETLRDLNALQKKLDRWLRPIGATGFVEPFERVAKFCSRFYETCKGMVTSLIFMSDGCDNQWDRSEILRAFDLAIYGGVHAVTIVEYGYYADRKLLGSLAERAGGAHIFADDFQKYEVDFEAALTGRAYKEPKVEFQVADDAIGGFVFALRNGRDITMAHVDGGVARLPADTKKVFYITPSTTAPELRVGDGGMNDINSALYAALSIYAMRAMPEVISAILRNVGDKHFGKRYSGLFGKQAYSQFSLDTRAAAFDVAKRMTEGYDTSFIPPDDAFTVLDLLSLLCEDKRARLLIDHPAFRYSKISRGRVDATEGPFERLKFEADKQPEGVPFLDLTWNEDRANVSLLVIRTGVVDLSGRLPFPGRVPSMFPTHVFRNYSVVCDGLKNLSLMPVEVSISTYEVLRDAGVNMPASPIIDGDIAQIIIDLDPMPVLSRSKVKAVRAFDLFSDQYELQKARAAQKVFKYYRDKLDDGSGKAVRLDDPFVTQYGVEAAAWLAEQGITYKGGYQPPKTAQAEAKDFYMGKVLEVSLSGLNSLPKVDDVIARMGKGKLTPAMELMAPFVEEVQKFHKSTGPNYGKWIEARATASIAEARMHLRKIAQTKFAVIVGQVWFPEFSTIGEGTMEMSFGLSKQISAKVEMKEEKVYL